MSLEFLSPDAATADERFTPLARTPLEGSARAAGAELEQRDGWWVAAWKDGTGAEQKALAQTVGFCDSSPLGKLELQAAPEDLAGILAAAGAPGTEARRAQRGGGAWWCPLAPARALVICAPDATASVRERLEHAAAEASSPASVLDVTCAYAAMTVAGPLARETFARFSALDLRPQIAPPGTLLPGSIGRQPAILIVEAPDRYLFLFGWATGEYMWTVVADAAEALGGRPVGVDALAPLPAGGEEGSPDA